MVFFGDFCLYVDFQDVTFNVGFFVVVGVLD